MIKKNQDKRYIITILMQNNVQNGSPIIDAVERMIKKQDKRYIITILMQNNVRNGSPIIDAVDTLGHIFTSKWQLKISYLVFFTILYHLLDCKMVYDRF